MTHTLPFVRRAALVLTTSAGLGLVGLAGPASAAVPEGWSNPPSVSALHAVLLLGGVPLLAYVVLTLLVYLPSMLRGERRSSGAHPGESQWFGGPSKGTSELPAPDNEESKAGGASGRW
ncbi:hypothetical protein [Nocardioides panaciterrulae]|uniref:Cellobiose-specific phosphotransferase system component IIC n=1 Tax=Nocardioides panaciterrulae TaxID=661492 RepID=A0A7Y9E7U4_9ACTN|nr:hypothetical protein [Nocardioides panaciterrulae]NYD42587.1 cellobiose-specific phosphotransferase system component IIC [Nocardioides panaciterrulae]